MKSRPFATVLVSFLLSGCGADAMVAPLHLPHVSNADRSHLVTVAQFTLVGGLPQSGPAHKVRSLTIIQYGSKGKPQVWNLSQTRCLPARPCRMRIRYQRNPMFLVRSYDNKGGAGKLLSTTIVTGTIVGLTLVAKVRYATLVATDVTPVFGKREQILLTGIGLDADRNFIIGPAPYDHVVRLKLLGSMSITSMKVSSAVRPVSLMYAGGYEYAHVALASKAFAWPSSPSYVTVRPLLSDTLVKSTLLSPGNEFATASDGSVWFADFGNCALVKIASNLTTTSYPVPTGIACPLHITTGPDGNVWFSSPQGAGAHVGYTGVGYVTPSGAIKAFPDSSTSSMIDMGPITTGSDGKLWIVDEFAGDIYTATTSGVISKAAYSLGIPDTSAIVAGPDGNLWIPFLDGYGNGFAVVSTNGTFVTSYAAKVESPTIVRGAYLYAIAKDPPRQQAIGQWDARGHLKAKYASADGQLSGSQFAIASDGSMWFGIKSAGYPISYVALGRISSSGGYCELSVPVPAADNPSAVTAMVFGGDGDLYYTAGPYLSKVVVPIGGY